MNLSIGSRDAVYEFPICNTVICGDKGTGKTRLLYVLIDAIHQQFEKSTIYLCTRDEVDLAEKFADRFRTKAHEIEVLQLTDTPEVEIIGMGKAISGRRRLRVIDDVVFFLVDDFNLDVMRHPGSVTALRDWNASAEANKTFLYAVTNGILFDCMPSCQIETHITKSSSDFRATVKVNGHFCVEFPYH